MNDRMIRLSPRLQCVADCVRQGARFADVGTDHGYLPAWLLQAGLIERAIASDINPGPLASARSTAARYGLADRIDFRLCAGLEGIEAGEADTVAIAGMGGETVIGIIESAGWDWTGVTLLLQPMTKAELLRPWLAGNGFDIKTERLTRDRGILYTVLTVESGSMPELSRAEAWCGRGVQADPLYGEYAMDRVRKLERAAEGMRRGGRANEASVLDADASALRKTVREREYADGT